MNRFNVFVIILFSFLFFGLFLFFLGSNTKALANSAIDEWMPKREYVCFDHSGEFSELFNLCHIGNKVQNFGTMIIFGVGLIGFFISLETIKGEQE